MPFQPRLHWSTLGEPTQGVELAWAATWELSLDRSLTPSLPPDDTDLWVISAEASEPPPALLRAVAEVGALPILLVPSQRTCAFNLKHCIAWSTLGSVRWGLLDHVPPQPGLRPLASHLTPLSAAQTLGLGLVGISAAMQVVLVKARSAAATKATVLLEGESGTGKEVVARAIHRMSLEASGPFVPVHCGAIPENLLESELFGYTKGAFTDARKDTPGKFREAHGGTIFLDEVGTMPLAAQVHLLRVLQEKEVQPLGGGGPVKVDVRVIAATNMDLKQRVEEGTFRKDLYYRLDVVPITLPPLHQRREEIPFLAQHFLNRKAREHGLYPKAIHPSVDALLKSLPWPGNVRQLENAIERAIVLSSHRPVLTRDDFQFLQEPALSMQPESDALPILEESTVTCSAASMMDLPPEGLDLNEAVSTIEKRLILQSLQITRGNKKRAAELLCLKRTTFLEKMKRLEILEEEGAGENVEMR